MDRYTIKSTSEDGIFYLVNGWRDEYRIWEIRPVHTFKREQDARASLTKLFKSMGDEYHTDTLELVHIADDGTQTIKAIADVKRVIDRETMRGGMALLLSRYVITWNTAKGATI